ncbi:MAG: hypothetical protein AB7N65_13460 [Vicinamibacterales bacterium]
MTATQNAAIKPSDPVALYRLSRARDIERLGPVLVFATRCASVTRQADLGWDDI